jgi:Uma2 family endonuclease
VAPLKTKPRKTVEDYLKLPEGTRAELIEGEIFMSPSPRTRHQRVVRNIFRLVDGFVRAGGLGEVFFAPFDVHLRSGDVLEPDVILVLEKNRPIIQDWIRGTPDLLVEVLSPENPERDRVVKRDLYARAGVSEYWIVDPEGRSVEVLTLSGKRYEEHGYFEESDTLVSPLLPGFSPSLREFLA